MTQAVFEEVDVEDFDVEGESQSKVQSWKDWEPKYKTLVIIISIITLLSIGYFVSLLLSILVSTLCLLYGGFMWVSSTNLSVEITVFLGKFFAPSSKCVWNCAETPECRWSEAFRNNYKTIHGEYLNFEAKYNYCPQMDEVYPNGSITNWDKKWPTVNLRVYGLDTEIAKYFPKTMELVNGSDMWLSHVMFSILKPNKFIPRHRGPYRGVFRYHLSLEIPPYTNAANELYLAVWPNTSSVDFWDPMKVPPSEPVLVSWKNGSDFLFDDTCVHEVINYTKQRRIILFMDVERHDVSFVSKCVHRFFMGLAKYLPTIRKCKEVQDRYLKTWIDEQTKQPIRCTQKSTDNQQFDFDLNSSNWRWFSPTPEILPYKKARAMIEKSRANPGL
eukprot:240697_1